MSEYGWTRMMERPPFFLYHLYWSGRQAGEGKSNMNLNKA